MLRLGNNAFEGINCPLVGVDILARKEAECDLKRGVEIRTPNNVEQWHLMTSEVSLKPEIKLESE